MPIFDHRAWISGNRRALLVLGVLLLGANLRAPITSLGPVLPDMQRALQLSGGAAGLLHALPLLVFAVLSLVAPRIGRRYGMERVLGFSVAAIFFGTVVRSVAAPGAVWLGAALLSAGIAFGNVLLPGLVKRLFPSRATTVIGLYAATMAIFAGIASSLAVPIARLDGANWRWSIGVWSVPALVTLLFWLPYLRAPQHRADANKEELSAFVSPWSHPLGWYVAMFFALHSFIFYSIVDWFASYAATRGISLASSGVMLFVYQLVAAAANVGIAPILRRARSQVLIGVACGLSLLVGTSGLLLAPGLSMLWLLFAGLGAGMSLVATLAFFGLRTSDHHQAAALSGMAQFIGYTGGAAGPLLMGVIHDATGSWTPPLLVLIASSALLAVFAGLAGRRRVIQ
jgi:MFS transporter, CP family, cyanate transporter